MRQRVTDWLVAVWMGLRAAWAHGRLEYRSYRNMRKSLRIIREMKNVDQD